MYILIYSSNRLLILIVVLQVVVIHKLHHRHVLNRGIYRVHTPRWGSLSSAGTIVPMSLYVPVKSPSTGHNDT